MHNWERTTLGLCQVQAQAKAWEATARDAALATAPLPRGLRYRVGALLVAAGHRVGGLSSSPAPTAVAHPPRR